MCGDGAMSATLNSPLRTSATRACAVGLLLLIAAWWLPVTEVLAAEAAVPLGDRISLSFSSPRLNLHTGRYELFARLTHTGGDPLLLKSLALTVRDLKSPKKNKKQRISLASGSGTGPDGSTLLAIPVDGGMLAPGAQLDEVLLEFRDPRKKPRKRARNPYKPLRKLPFTFSSGVVGLLNTPPVAEAGPPRTVPLRSVVPLDGSGSTDRDGDLLSYRWTLRSKPRDSQAHLAGADSVSPSFRADRPGAYGVELIVNDGQSDSAPDTVTISTENSAPVAKAGPDQTVPLGATVTLDGRGSSDSDGDPLAYAWALSAKPAGSQAALSNAAAATPGFVADRPGHYTVQLVVSDGAHSSAPDTVAVDTQNSRPVADAGGNRTAATGDLLTLDGSASRDPDGQPLSHAWSLITKPAGSQAALQNPTAPQCTLTPDVAGDYVAQLIVSDGSLDSLPATARITATSPGTANQAPQITSTPVTAAQVGQIYQYAVQAADPDSDTLGFGLASTPPGPAIDPASGLIQWTPASAGSFAVTVTVSDGQGGEASQSFTIEVTDVPGPGNQAPQISSSPLTNVAVGQAYQYAIQASDPDGGTLSYALTAAPAGMDIDPASGQITWTPASAGDVAVTVTVSDGQGGETSQSFTVTVLAAVPPADPAATAPAPDPTIGTTIRDSIDFLYSGDHPLQTGVPPGTIEVQRAAVIRGQVLDKQNQPLAGVVVTILGHPEYGQTLSRADGMFDLAVNGGGLLTVDYRKTGFLPVQRQVKTPWQDYVWADTVVMIALDSRVTAIDLSAGTALQVARGSLVTDADGSRQATLLFPAGTQATMTLPDGSTRPLTKLNVRATEYTVGDNGPEAMPGALPPASAYTYAVELSVDEALAAGASEVRFSQPVYTYLQNFIGFPVGSAVPAGYYDRAKGLWVASANGRVIQVLGISGGLADLDTDGDGQADTADQLAALQVTDAERQKLASLYTAGQSLWRVPVQHFTPWDFNWPWGLPPGATPPNQPSPEAANPPVDTPEQACGSIIGCETQTLGEALPVAGTPFRLHYQSERQAGDLRNYTLDIPLSGATVPDGMYAIRLIVEVAGRKFEQQFKAQPNLSHSFTWDGRNAYGQAVQGPQPVKILIGYVYTPVYYSVRSDFADSFGNATGQGITVQRETWTTNSAAGTSVSSRITVWQEQKAALGVLDSQKQGLGGWSLDIHHAYAPLSQVLYLGDGGKHGAAESVARIINRYAGATAYPSDNYDGMPALEVGLGYIEDIAADARGNLYIANTRSVGFVDRVDPQGRITRFAGAARNCPDWQDYCGEGGPATEARIPSDMHIAAGPDGSLYMAGNHRLLRVNPDGIISTIAGGDTECTETGDGANCGDGGPALQAKFTAYWWGEIAVGPDGSLYTIDWYSNGLLQRIRRIGPDGNINTVAGGTDASAPAGDGAPAVTAPLSLYIENIEVGPDGSLYFSQGDYNGKRIRRIGPDGILRAVAGTGTLGSSGDGGLATDATIAYPTDITVARDGTLYFLQHQFDYYANKVYDKVLRAVSPDGIIQTIAGKRGYTDADGYSGDGGLAASAQFTYFADRLALSPDGKIYVSDRMPSNDSPVVRRIGAFYPGVSVSDLLIPSESGDKIYHFDSHGRHLRTLNAQTGAVLYRFGYDAKGYLATVTDGDGNISTIERDAGGNPTAIMAPFGQRTVLALDAHGYLASVTNPAGEAYQMTYTAEGLLTQFTDPQGHASRLTYDDRGSLLKDEDAAGGSQTLARTQFATGYEVSLTSALGRAATHGVENLPAGGLKRTSKAPDGTATETLIGTDGSEKTTLADGTVIERQDGPDPRFGMQAPVLKSLAITTGGLTSTLAGERTVDLADPNNLLSLKTLTDKLTVNGRTSTSIYDAATRTLTHTSAAGRTGTATLDALGRMIQAQAPGLLAVVNAYDAKGRLSSSTQGEDQEARTVSFGYNDAGLLATVTDPLGRTLGYEYDAARRITRHILPDAREVLYGYDADGNLTSVTPPGRPAHAFKYTPVSLQSEYVPPDVGAGSNSTLYSYNLDKQLTQITRPDGQILAFSYDSAGRLSKLGLPGGDLSYGYDAATGKLTGLTAPDGVSLSYGYAGALLTQAAWAGTVAGSVGYGYDNDFRVTRINVNGADPIAYQYDTDGLLTQAGDLVLVRAADNGFLSGTTLNKINDSLSYNGFGETTRYEAKVDAGPLYAVDYGYDKLGRLVHKAETAGIVANTYEYGYDSAGRLVEVKLNGGVVSGYTYDANGNRLTRTRGLSLIAGSYDNQDRLLSYGETAYAYTANGELKTRTAGGQTTSYDYDLLGNLRKVTLPDGRTIDYVIDARNRRIGKKVNGTLVQGILYQDQLKPIAELDGNNAVVSRFIYAAHAHVPGYLIKGGVTYRLITDHLGSPRFVVNVADGTIAQRMDYDEFGNVTADSHPGFQPFGYAGGLYDPDTKLVRFGARDYDAETGRWTAKDPLRFEGGDSNLYGYVLNDPVNAIDPSGLFSAEDLSRLLGVDPNPDAPQNNANYDNINPEALPNSGRTLANTLNAMDELNIKPSLNLPIHDYKLDRIIENKRLVKKLDKGLGLLPNFNDLYGDALFKLPKVVVDLFDRYRCGQQAAMEGE
jgi:RHS repeat-associated protein